MSFERDRPYNDLPLLSPQGITLKTAPILNQAIENFRELAELKGAGGLVPNQPFLLSGIVLQETRPISVGRAAYFISKRLMRALAG